MKRHLIDKVVSILDQKLLDVAKGTILDNGPNVDTIVNVAKEKRSERCWTKFL